MYKLIIAMGLAAASCALSAQTQFLDSVHGGTFQVKDEAFLSIVDMVYGIEILADGHEWTEGPLWLEEQGLLLYNDIPRNATYAWSQKTGVFEYLNPSGYTGTAQFEGAEPGANGMDLNPKGQMVMCQHGDRRIARLKGSLKSPKSKFKTVASTFQGKRFNSPNDLVIHSSGAIFFTDPPYGLPGQMDDPEKELEFQGVYRVDPDGSVYLLSKSFSRPNGIALSADEKTLYVANSDPGDAYWKKFDVADDLALYNESAFHYVTDRVGSHPGLPDGLKVRSDGTVFASGPGGIFLFTPEGKELGRIMTGQATSNCALDTDENYLYITADMYLLRVKLK